VTELNSLLIIPLSPMKKKQDRLLGKLNRMMGDDVKSNKEQDGKRLSWEDIPLFVGGKNKITP